jgi:hypothetical protein
MGAVNSIWADGSTWADLEHERANEAIDELLKSPVIESAVPILGAHSLYRWWVHHKIGVV